MECVVMAIIQNERILMQHRDNKPYIKYPGYWAVPGGGIEKGELLIEALIREYKEEIVFKSGYNAPKFCFIGTVENAYKANEYVFAMMIENNREIECCEGQESAFFDLNKVLEMPIKIPSHHRRVLELVLDYYKKYLLTNLKEVACMLNGVEDYVSVTCLGTEKKPLEYEKTGKGYIVKKGNALTALYHNREPVCCLAYIEFEPGKTRGDHFHYKKVENMCVVKGKIKAQYMLPNNPEKVLELELKAGDIVHILPGCAHSYMADEWAVALEYSPQKFELSDTEDIEFNW